MPLIRAANANSYNRPTTLLRFEIVERVYVRHPHTWDFAASTLLRVYAHWRAQLRVIHFSHIPKKR